MSSEKRNNVLYWVFTIPFALGMLMSALFYIFGGSAVVLGFAHLGYPAYLITILATAKILGVIAIVSGISNWLKEWAYAGFTFNILGAAASHAFSGDDFASCFVPLVILAIMFGSYFYWKKRSSKALETLYG